MSEMATHPLYPFLSALPNGEFAYRATQSGDLRRFFEAVRADPRLVRKIKQIYLTMEYDDYLHSGVVEFVTASRTGNDDDTAAADTGEDVSDARRDSRWVVLIRCRSTRRKLRLRRRLEKMWYVKEVA